MYSAISLFSLILLFADAEGPDAVALVTDIADTPQTEVGLFDEISVGTEIVLGDVGTISAFHYPSCAQITATGGTVIFNEDFVEGVDNASFEEVPETCATVVADSDDRLGGVILRQAEEDLLIPVRPIFIQSGAITSIAVSDCADGWRYSFAQKGAVFVLPSNETDLPAGDVCVEVERQPEGGRGPSTIKAVVSDNVPASAPIVIAE